MTVIRSLEHLTEMALDKKATKEIGELRHLLNEVRYRGKHRPKNN